MLHYRSKFLKLLALNILCLKTWFPYILSEVQCINEYETYLTTLVHDIGMQLHSVATCTGLQCIRYDSFTLEHALLRKHWTLQFLMVNMAQSHRLLRESKADERQKLPTLVESDINHFGVSVTSDDQTQTLCSN
jgi:tRNA U55 pseudouridine synthase TruB